MLGLKKKVMNIVCFWINLFFVFSYVGATSGQTPGWPLVNPAKIAIVRDNWGVPHIYAPTDAEVAYGLAYAFCEDNFTAVQEAVLMVAGRSGEVHGPKGAAMDYFTRYVRAREEADQSYERDLSPEFRRILEAYAQGVNAYAFNHRDQWILDRLFPINGKAVAQGFVTILAGMVGLGDALKFILDGNPDDFIMQPGSNAIAISPRKSTDYKTHIVINPHVPVDGTFAFYEAHLHSDEGLNILGAFFPGMPMPGMGITPNHAWAVTFNWPDYVDIYEMELHPKNKNKYKFDGQWYDFERTKEPLKVKLGGIIIKVKREVLWCKYGPAIRDKKGKVYATRFVNNKPIRAAEEWYRMAKATNLNEFKNALRLQSIPHFNFIYADKNRDIYYVHNSLLPNRNPKFNWQKTVPGNTSETLWDQYLPFDQLPQVENPECGYVYNTNNSPFFATGMGCNVDSNAFSPTYCLKQNRENNRDHRLRELFEGRERISPSELRSFKYDCQYPKSGPARKIFQSVLELKPEDYPKLADAIRIVRQWNLKGDVDNRHAGLAIYTFYHAYKKLKYGFVQIECGVPIPQEQLLKSLSYAQKVFWKTYGTLTPKWGEVQRLVRGTGKDFHSFPMPGLPEVLAPSYSEFVEKGPYKKYFKGRLKVMGGDTFTAFATFGEKGLEKLETVVPFGSSARPGNRHFVDQAPLYSTYQTKSMTLDKNEILKNAERVYRPE
jgi:acyl-homoserine-lactone acylase